MFSRGILASAVAVLLSGCALQQSNPKIALDYNRDFAKSRNEMLLLNVLRAAAREPLQFSTMGGVTGAVGNSGTLKIPFTNLIAGGADIISPELTLNDGINPSITINPLGSKEFASGILNPLRTDTIQLFIHNGWDAEFLLPLVVGAVICPDGRKLFNSGEFLRPDGQGPSELHIAFKKFFRDFAESFSIGQSQERSFVLTDKEALDVLKTGLGNYLAITKVTAGHGANAGKTMITVQDTSEPAVRGNAAVLVDLCNTAGVIRSRENALRRANDLHPLSDARVVKGREKDVMAAFPINEPGSPPLAAAADSWVIFRSVASIIQYLGESHRVRFREGATDGRGLTYLNRNNDDQILFKIDWGLEADSDAVSTVFQGKTFRILQLNLRRGERDDRTLKALSFLDQLIALQTSESVIRGAQPVITVN